MGSISIVHWIVVVGLLCILFGRNVVSGFMADLGKGIRTMRHINEEDAR